MADIEVKDPCASAGPSAARPWNRLAGKVANIAAKAGAVLAMTGDNSCNLEYGMVVTNGTLRRSNLNRKRDLLVIKAAK